MIIQKINAFGKRLLLTETSVHKLALSTSLGIFVAFSPLLFLHTAMAIGLSWLFSFNMGVTLAVSAFVHNPLTVILIYGIDLAFGEMMRLMSAFDALFHTPQSLNSLCVWASSYIGLPAHCIWTFFIGGNVLSVLLAIIMYWPAKWFFASYQTDGTLAS